MNLSLTKLRVLRSIGLLLVLAASVAGFMTLIDLLAETTPQDTNELLAETDSQPDFISLPSSGSLFAIGLATVAIIVALRRVIQLNAQAREMENRGVDSMERDAVIRNEAVSIAVVIAASLALASVMVVIGAAVGRAETVSGLVPWTVATVGITATLLLAGFLLFLYRGLSGGPQTEPIDTEEDSVLTDEPEPEPS